MIPRDSEALAEVAAFCEMTECVRQECESARKMVEDEQGHEHDQKGLFTHKGGGGAAAAKPGKKHPHGGKPVITPPPRGHEQHKARAQRAAKIQHHLKRLEHHEVKAGHHLHKAAEAIETGVDAMDAFEVAHGHPFEASGAVMDFIAMSIPHVKRAVLKYRAFLERRLGHSQAKVVMAAGSAMVVALKFAVPGVSFVPLAGIIGSIPALGIAEACRFVQKCGQMAAGAGRLIQAAAKLPGIAPIASGVGKVVGAYTRGRGRLETKARHGIGSAARSIASVMPGRQHLRPGEGNIGYAENEDDDPDGILDEPELDDATIQREAEKFAAYILKTYKELLAEHGDKLAGASQSMEREMRGGDQKGNGNVPRPSAQ